MTISTKSRGNAGSYSRKLQANSTVRMLKMYAVAAACGLAAVYTFTSSAVIAALLALTGYGFVLAGRKASTARGKQRVGAETEEQIATILQNSNVVYGFVAGAECGDPDCRAGDVDFLVAATTGIFSIEAKTAGGRISWDPTCGASGNLIKENRAGRNEFTRNRAGHSAVEQTLDHDAGLRARTGEPVHHVVVVSWMTNERPLVVRFPGRPPVTVCSTKQLVSVLRSGSEQLTSGAAARALNSVQVK